jgi:type IV secretory pathway VirB10-like protein
LVKNIWWLAMLKRFLTSGISFGGFSRAKIISLCLIVVGVIVGVVISQNSNDCATDGGDSDGKLGGHYIKPNHGDDIDNIMQKLAPLDNNSLSRANSRESQILSTPLTNLSPDNNKQSSSLDKTAASDIQVPSTEIIERGKFRDAQTANMYASVKGKSLVYSIKPVNSTAIAANSSTSSTDVIEQSNIYSIKAGGVIPAIMLNGLNSELPGDVVAIVRANIYDSITRRYLLIPQGSKLVGRYDSNVMYGQERIAVAWNRLIYPDGSSTILKAVPGTDIEGYSGFYDQVDNHYFRLFGASFIMGVITGAMQYSQNNTNTTAALGANPTAGQTVAGSLGQQMGQTGMMITQKNLNIAPTVVIRPNYPFSLLITADLNLKPFARIDN